MIENFTIEYLDMYNKCHKTHFANKDLAKKWIAKRNPNIVRIIHTTKEELITL